MDLSEFFSSVWVQMAGMVLFAAFHGYGAAWLAVRMLFRPRRSVKVLGLTVFPQGMIPRHRDRLANAIGKAVGQELVSGETVIEHLFEEDFLENKIQTVVDNYTDELLGKSYPSFIEALPENLREPIVESAESLRDKIGEYVEKVLSSETTADSIAEFIDKQVDGFLDQTVAELFTDETYSKLMKFADDKARSLVEEPKLEEKLREFLGKRVDDLANTETPLGEMFTDDAIKLLKEKAVEQIDPIVHQLAELATEDRTKDQISSLIKKEVHAYYEQLPFIKKIFVSRDTLLREVDDLVDDSLPKRIEETLQGDFFADEASSFVNKTIDKTLEKPLPELIGSIDEDHLENLKDQLTASIIKVLRSDRMRKSLSGFITDSLENLGPQKVGDSLESIHPDSVAEIKETLTRGMTRLLQNQNTAEIVNSVLSAQLDSLMHAPIGRLEDHVSEHSVRSAGKTLTLTIVSTAREKLPEAIKEFDVGGMVRDKVNGYPEEKLESLVLGIAKEHLRTIEAFGFFFGVILGIGQAAIFYFSNH